MLKDQLNKIGVSLIGNRLATVGNIGLASLILNISTKGFEPSCSSEQLSYCASGIALGLSAITGFGASTGKLYSRTVDHLKKFKKLDERFFDKMMGFDDSTPLVGYCQLQSMYLACRDYAPEQLDTFYKLKKENTRNVVPNF